MREEKKYLVGEFSEKTGLSIRTLHYYDDIGLLKPAKNPSSGHRLYTDEDVLTLQKIISFKFLGYSLEKIHDMMHQSSFEVSLNESLQMQMKALEEEKEHIDKSLSAIQRTITLLEEEGEVDSAVLMSLINNVRTEKTQREWMENYMPMEVADTLYNKTEEEKIELDKEFIHLSKEVKRLVGKPVDDPDVQKLVESYAQKSLQFMGEDAIQALSDIEINGKEQEEIDKIAPSPFSKEEEVWLDQAMEYYMKRTGMYEPTDYL